ncbi:MAG TPA: hypothetical protein VFT82_04205 [Candidatus Paceibacterota bacterium]|nr:hypothetical protein [Candidatus Paceibacterota bacterium]
MERKNIVSGIWKFRDRVSVEELGEVAKKWAEDKNYLQLYVRRASNDQYGIGFMYQLPKGTEKHDVYFDVTTDALKRKFGNDLIGWDLASPTWIVK